jgi:hypothetical protein
VDNVVHGQITELHVQTIKLTAETKIAVLAALYAYALAPEILVTIRKHDDNPRVIALIIESWPPDEDGKFTIGLLFTHLTILWRAWALYEIAAGRGLHKNSEEYAAKLGIKIIPAFDYVARRLKGTGSRSTNGDRTAWTNGFKWVRYDGNVEKPWKNSQAKHRPVRGVLGEHGGGDGAAAFEAAQRLAGDQRFAAQDAVLIRKRQPDHFELLLLDEASEPDGGVRLLWGPQTVAFDETQRALLEKSWRRTITWRPIT